MIGWIMFAWLTAGSLWMMWSLLNNKPANNPAKMVWIIIKIILILPWLLLVLLENVLVASYDWIKNRKIYKKYGA
jgi:hypothetical protein